MKIKFKEPRKIRKANGSRTIALPTEVIEQLKIKDDKEVNIIILNNGKVQIEKGDK